MTSSKNFDAWFVREFVIDINPYSNYTQIGSNQWHVQIYHNSNCKDMFTTHKFATIRNSIYQWSQTDKAEIVAKFEELNNIQETKQMKTNCFMVSYVLCLSFSVIHIPVGKYNLTSYDDMRFSNTFLSC